MTDPTSVTIADLEADRLEARRLELAARQIEDWEAQAIHMAEINRLNRLIQKLEAKA